MIIETTILYAGNTINLYYGKHMMIPIYFPKFPESLGSSRHRDSNIFDEWTNTSEWGFSCCFLKARIGK